jgi:hypothetical protein
MNEERMSEELRQRVAQGTYEVDPEAVAEAVLRRWLAARFSVGPLEGEMPTTGGSGTPPTGSSQSGS